MTTNASRAPVDFDAFARDLQPTTPPQSQAQPAAKPDPLAELARIVGQDDPFRALLEARDSRATAEPRVQGGRREPSFHDEAPAAPAGYAAAPSGYAQHAQHQVEPEPQAAHSAHPADAFDQYLASVDHSAYAAGPQDPHGSEAYAPEQDDRLNRAAERPRQRSRLVSVGAGLGVLVVCVTGALTWRSMNSSHSDGTVPTILADKAPLKIAPQKADGVEIPDQNKRIYDRNAKDDQIHIVNREEQPVDVAQAARSAQRAGEGGATPSTGQQGGNTGPLTETLGEPRRVRTVSVKPDTPPPPPQREAPVAQSVIPTMTLPGDGGGSTNASMHSRVGKLPATTPAPTEEASAPEPTAPASRAKAPQRVAAVAPDATSALPTPAPAASASTAPVSGYSVQLGVRTSEAEAQAAFKQMQSKFSQLSGKPALIRQAEVSGKTIYRVRVGPLAKAEATTLCTELQGAGGQCFVAKN
ncbi:SPOR domain-containing protein [Methylobacterium sp. WCS2018Hpa-22]|uniref:SPOR domain-containing protein n=1 Tax=Methylobacterium sp. WCS2018Hpa-22 TaxID=3073633 RepID=UPI00288C1D03|nr:SPOR domain-containing protein [Methylobacterium sp. WCS2018Hpa-22]